MNNLLEKFTEKCHNCNKEQISVSINGNRLCFDCATKFSNVEKLKRIINNKKEEDKCQPTRTTLSILKNSHWN